MVLNNYWYLLCKMLLNEKTVYLLLPLAVYSLLAIAEFIPEGNPISTFTMNLGEGFIEGSLPAYLSVIILILLMIFINRTLQIRLLYSEISKVEDTKIKHVSEYKFLDRYGEIGEYIRLELKLYLRKDTVPHGIYHHDCFLMRACLHRYLRQNDQFYLHLQFCHPTRHDIGTSNGFRRELSGWSDEPQRIHIQFVTG